MKNIHFDPDQGQLLTPQHPCPMQKRNGQKKTMSHALTEPSLLLPATPVSAHAAPPPAVQEQCCSSSPAPCATARPAVT